MNTQKKTNVPDDTAKGSRGKIGLNLELLGKRPRGCQMLSRLNTLHLDVRVAGDREKWRHHIRKADSATEGDKRY